jgi:deazaflavin-dependent oxidoreductase (nitroreductase family)
MAEADLKQALEGEREVELTVTGRKSGEPSTRPVWFVEQDGKVYLLPVGGSGANWFKNLLRAPRIRLAAGGAEAETEGKVITDASAVKDVLAQFGEKYGASQVDQYYPGQDVAVEVALA